MLSVDVWAVVKIRQLIKIYIYLMVIFALVGLVEKKNVYVVQFRMSVAEDGRRAPRQSVRCMCVCVYSNWVEVYVFTSWMNILGFYIE